MTRIAILTRTLLIILLCQTCSAEPVKVATYNIQNFADMFDQQSLSGGQRDREQYNRDQEDLYEIARVITLPEFDPDIICIQECASQEMLELFNRVHLKKRYEFVQVFKGNSTSDQNLGMLARKGFKPVSTDLYYQDKDPSDKSGKKLLFSRGPAFVRFTTPAGNSLTVGVTHTKSKIGDNPEMVLRRGRQVSRLREICESYIQKDQKYVVLLGDFNDSFGMDENETKAGIDAVDQALGGTEQLKCLTKELQTQGKYSYHCQLKSDKYRSFLDHIFVSIDMVKYTKQVKVIDDPIADVASDHWPVMASFELP